MMKNNYTNYNENEKCQCITFDSEGSIMGSCDTLFGTSGLTTELIYSEFPFLLKIITYLNSHNDDSDALFFPHIEFECNGYRSICDFTFMKTVDALGISRFICMIYDNSIHYKDVIKSEYRKKIKHPQLNF